MNRIDTNILSKYCYESETTRDWLAHLEKTHLTNTELKAERYSDAIMVPDEGRLEAFSGGVFDANGQAIKGSFQRGGLLTAEKLRQNLDAEEPEMLNEEIVYLGQYRNQWGSFLVDSVSRLWYALDCNENCKFAFLATQQVLGGIHPNTWKFLNALGIKENQIYYITKPTRVKKLIIPEMSFVPYGTVAVTDHEQIPRYHRAYLDTIYRVTDCIGNINIDVHEKVYFSRSKFSKKSRTDFGEDLIVRMLQENNFYIVYPEEHSLEEQIFYVNTCKVFASIGGSCAHNIVFSKTRPQMILFNRMNGFQWHQWMLDEMAKVEPITYVDMYCEPFKAWFKTTLSGPYLYLINKNVTRFAADYHFVLPTEATAFRKKTRVVCDYTLQIVRTIVGRIYHAIIGH